MRFSIAFTHGEFLVIVHDSYMISTRAVASDSLLLFCPNDDGS